MHGISQTREKARRVIVCFSSFTTNYMYSTVDHFLRMWLQGFRFHHCMKMT